MTAGYSPGRPARRAWPAVLAALVLGAAAQAAEEPSFEQVLSAVVGVHADVPEDARTAAALGTEREGSGVVIDGNGLVVTIGYLILEASAVHVVVGEERIPAEIVAYDHESGFGLLRAGRPIDVKPMPLGDSASLSPPQGVLIASAGGPGSARPAMTVSRREFAGYWEYLLDRAIFTSPPYPLYGGAALVDGGGRLLGIGSLAVGDALRSADRVLPGNMFVPVDQLKTVMGDLLADGRRSGVRRPWLGMSSTETHGRLLVRRVARDGPAAAAGVEPGDLIVGVAGEPVESMADFYRKVWAQGEAGTSIAVTLLRGADLETRRIRSGDRYDWLRLGRRH